MLFASMAAAPSPFHCHHHHHHLLLLVLAAAAAAAPTAAAAGLSLDFHHRFSDRVRQWAEDHGLPSGARWPEKGTPEFFAALSHHDRVLHRRTLTDGSDLTFADGNATLQFQPLGLHYTIVQLGTPNATILVALDTGSSLFWVPCAQLPINVPGIYNPSHSLTSQNIPCNSSFCNPQSMCHGATNSCGYIVQYADNSSSVGILIEDVLYLRRQDAISEVVEAQITFGCSMYQSSVFTDTTLPCGIFGLGMTNMSVPSILSSKGIMSNSFSMCFGIDGIGRINFGDKGSLDQEETPFNIDKSGHYYISVTGMEVGNSSINVEFSALVDSGASLTYLSDPMYTKLAESVHENWSKPYHSFLFEFCYDLSLGQTCFLQSNISLIAKGGSKFPFSDPMIMIEEKQKNVYTCCLAVVKSRGLNIIGQNFMTGLRVVFDREKLILGWKQFDCYTTENSSTTLPQNVSPAPSPAVASGPSSYPGEAPNPGGHNSQIVHTPPNHSSRLNSRCSICMFLVLFFMVL